MDHGSPPKGELKEKTEKTCRPRGKERSSGPGVWSGLDPTPKGGHEPRGTLVRCPAQEESRRELGAVLHGAISLASRSHLARISLASRSHLARASRIEMASITAGQKVCRGVSWKAIYEGTSMLPPKRGWKFSPTRKPARAGRWEASQNRAAAAVVREGRRSHRARRAWRRVRASAPPRGKT